MIGTTFVLENRHSDEGERRALWGDRDAAWLIQRWGSGDRLFVIADPEDVDVLRAGLDHQPRVIGRARDKLLVVNFPGEGIRVEGLPLVSSEGRDEFPELLAQRYFAGMPSTSMTP